jgi:hypothetical protein
MVNSSGLVSIKDIKKYRQGDKEVKERFSIFCDYLESILSEDEFTEAKKFLEDPTLLYIIQEAFRNQRVFSTSLSEELSIPRDEIINICSKLVEDGYLKEISIGHYRINKCFPGFFDLWDKCFREEL